MIKTTGTPMKKRNDMLAALLKKDKCILSTFGVLEKSPLKIGTGVVLCMAERFGAFDRSNLVLI